MTIRQDGLSAPSRGRAKATKPAAKAKASPPVKAAKSEKPKPITVRVNRDTKQAVPGGPANLEG